MIPIKAREKEAQLPLNQKLELWQLRLSEELDETGAKVDEDVFIKRLWGNVKVIRGMESLENGKKVPYQLYKIKIRHDSSIEESMYLKYKNRVLDIKSIINLEERSLYLELECMDRVMASG